MPSRLKLEAEMETENRSWRNLAASIVNTAVTDRKKAMKNLTINPEHEEAKKILRDCESFFCSSWCDTLLDFCDVGVSGERLLEVLNGR